MTKHLREVAVLTGVAIVASQSHVHGYIDPGSTSMLLQGIIGGIAAAIVVTRSYWSRLISAVRRTPEAQARVTDGKQMPHRSPDQQRV